MRMKEARLNAGLTLAQLAAEVGVSAAAIQRYENGLRTPRIGIAKKIGAVLGVPWYELVDNKKVK